MNSEKNDLIVKYITGETSEKETAEVEALRQNDADFKAKYDKFLLYWESSKDFANDFNPDVEKAFLKIRTKTIDKPHKGKQRTLILRLSGVAASIILLLGFSYLFFLNHGNIFLSRQAYQTEDNVQHIILPDSSVINLNRHSKLIVQRSFNEEKRQVILEGEAFFTIAKNPEKPFIVKTGKVKTSVLGTSFNIYENKEQKLITLSVFTGKVHFTTKSNGITLEKNQAVIYNTDEKQISEPSALNINSNAWLTKELHFVDTPLPELLQTLEHTYNIRFDSTQIEEINHISFTGSFSDMPHKDVLQIIGLTISIEFKELDQGTFIVIEDIPVAVD